MSKSLKVSKDVDKEVPFYKIDYGAMFYYHNYLFIKMFPCVMKFVGYFENQDAVKPNAFSLRNFEFTTIGKDEKVTYCGEETRNDLLTAWGYKDAENYID